MRFPIVRKKLLSTLLSHTKQPKVSPFLLGCHSFTTIPFSGSLERIPYSNKFCLVSSPIKFEEFNHLPQEKFRDYMEKNYEWGFLPSSDWRVKRVGSIAAKLIAVMNEGLLLDKAYKINGTVYEPSRPKISEERRLIWKPVTEHLNGREWEFYVAEHVPCNAVAAPTGKVVIRAFVLAFPDFNMVYHETFVASFIGHEIGIIVANYWRREAGIYQCYGVLLLGAAASVLFGVIEFVHFFILLPVAALLGILFQRFLSRRIIAEADYIGLILMASAGYDPRMVPVAYEGVSESEEDDFGLFSTHYSRFKRARLLRRSKVMKQALEIYEEAKAGKGGRKFV